MQEEEAEGELDAKQEEVLEGEENSVEDEEKEDTQKQVRDTMLESLKLGAFSIKGTVFACLL